MNPALNKALSSAAKSAVALLFVAGATAETPKDGTEIHNWELARGALGLLPETDSPYAAAGVEYLEKQIGRKLTEDERALLSRNASGKWKTFSDDLVSFDLPDDPLLTVKAFAPDENPQLRVVGGAVGTTDNSFERVYRITFADKVPYGLVLVTDNGWFDEGICLCGPIALKTFVHLNGNLIEMSQLPSGAVKKFQTINDTHRAILFEWTHSAITQSAYFRIGASLRLKSASTRSREDWITLSRQHRGLEAGLGWLRLGTKVDEVISLLGKPARQGNNELQYTKDEREDNGRGRRSTFTIPISQGQLARFDSKWCAYEELEAPRDSSAWIEDTLRAWSDKADELPEGDMPKLPSQDVQFILKLFHDKAGTSTGSDWDFWCRAIADLARLGVKKDSAAKLVLSRSGEMDLPQFNARWVLELYDLPECREFVQKRLGFLMGDAKTAAAHRYECQNLFASLEPRDEASMKLIRQGATHESENVREAAVFFADKLLPEEAVRILRAALSDSSEMVRWHGILNVSNICTKDDLEWLQKALRAETNARNRKALVEEIGRLERAPESKRGRTSGGS